MPAPKLARMSLPTVTEANFEAEVLRAPLPVLLLISDVISPASGEVRNMLLQAAREHEGKLKALEARASHVPMLLQALRVQSLPMLYLFQGGQPVAAHPGALTAQALRELIQTVLPRSQAEISGAELAQLLKQRAAVPLDIRDAAAHARCRIPGALHAELRDVDAAKVAPSDGRLRVLYGRTQEEAQVKAEALAAEGVEVAFLAGGFLHWEADGFDIERS